MVETRYRSVAQNQAGARVREVDEGLRSYMLGVYNLMALGVALTAIVSLAVAANPTLLALVAGTPLKWVLFIALLGLGWFAPRMIFSGSAGTAHAAYWSYAGLWGLLIAPMIALYMNANPGIVVQAFGITAVTFAATSLVGYTTKRDLSGFSTFFMMASIGLVVAIIANAIFFQSAMFSLLTSVVVVLLFSAITAWETQSIKEMYYEGDTSVVAKQKSIFGAFMLYGSFITLFVHILNILGIMRQN
ncbi:MAG: Bax inhibitor-1/YccA family protein [Hyphomicrobiales bacterium]